MQLINRYTTDGVVDWNPIWIIITIMSAVLLGLFALLFRDDAAAKTAPAPSE